MKKDPKDNSTGFVYILTNPAFREDWIKIGRSSRRVDVRSKELDNTAVPLPFQIFATLQTSKYIEVEKLIHSMIDGLTSLRIRTNREFFNIKPEVALGFFHKVAETIDDAVVKQYKDNLPIGNENRDDGQEEQKKGHRRSRFKFSMVGIMPGEWVVFEPTKKRVKVVDDSKVRFEGKEYTLSRFASEFMPKEAQNSSGVYQGTRYFSYRGKNLVELRLGMQEKNESQQINVIDEIGTKPEVIHPSKQSIDPDAKEIAKQQSRKPPFRFSMVGIARGESVLFDPLQLPVKVVSDTEVSFDGTNYTLSGFAAKFMPEEFQIHSEQYQGSRYFSYQGKKLQALGMEKENAFSSVSSRTAEPKSNEKPEDYAKKRDSSKNRERNWRRTPFRFSLVGISPGEHLVFVPTGVVVEVISDTLIRYEEREYTLSGFTNEFMPKESQFPSKAYRGPKFFTYRGKNLVDLRLQKEREGKY